MNKPFVWSYTALSDYETCPRAFAAKRIHKTVKPDYGPEALEGQKYHKDLEDHYRDGKAIPEELIRRYPLAKQVSHALAKRGETFVELKMGVSKDLKRAGFFSDDVWARGVVDLLIQKESGATLLIYDHKFGKVKDDLTQLQIFALFSSLYFPRAQRFICKNIWYKAGKITPENNEGDIYTREMLPDIWREILGRVHRMYEAIEAENFVARPSGLCKRHCAVVDCPHNGGYLK